MTHNLSRRVLLALPLGVAACGLAERPYAEQREWPLSVRRANALPARVGGLVLELRGLRAAPGLESRGLRTLETDGSLRTEYYEQWAVPPAQGVEEALRAWLAQSGLFAAVVGPGSRTSIDLALEGELTELWDNAGNGSAQCGVAITVIDVRTATRRILLQQTMVSSRPKTDLKLTGSVQAQLLAVSDVLSQIEAALASTAMS